MLTYVAHMPHSPALLPKISRDKFRSFKKAAASVEEIASDLYCRNIDTIITITPQGAGLKDAFVLNSSPKYRSYFGHLADFVTKKNFDGDTTLAYYIRAELCSRFPIKSATQEKLDGASSTAMMQITKNKQYKILPLTYSLDETIRIFEFGKNLRDAIENVAKKIAVISLGDMARTSKRTASQGKALDKILIDKLHGENPSSLVDHKISEIDSFRVCGYRPLALVLGLLNGMNYKTDVLNYEQRLGVGMMVARFAF